MYCMSCGGEIPEGGESCPACGAAVPRRVPPPAAPLYPQAAYPPQGYAPYPNYPQQPGYPAYPQQPYPQQPYPQQYGYPPQGYGPYPNYPQQPGYPAGWASSPRPYYVVARMTSPLPAKPPLKKRMGERWRIYAEQAGKHRVETGLSFAAAGTVVLGVLAMMLTAL